MKNKKRKQFVARQGDVLIRRISKIEAEVEMVKPTNGRAILAHGEATGHHHSVDIDHADHWKRGDVQYLTVHKSTAVTHQEHAPIPLKPGRYEVIRQVEYTPAEIRRVAD